ncbi:MAG TPA: hypothetical protein VF533_06025 [Solirubrobacteraceae bacterium]|jgi:hypothetical protein
MSSRLRRAADAERAELDRHRERLERERLRLREELARIEAAVAEVDERQRLLDRISPRPPEALPHKTADAGPVTRSASGYGSGGAAANALRGPAIREAAVRLLRDDARGAEALHYRDWYGRLIAAGHVVAGKDPLAVFLTQITRSPVVRKSTQAGVYELDRGAPAQLRERLAELHEELRQLTAAPAAMTDLGAIRARRDDLNAEIGQTEKALEEASALLEAGSSSALAS